MVTNSFAYQDCRRVHMKNLKCTRTLGGRGFALLWKPTVLGAYCPLPKKPDSAIWASSSPCPRNVDFVPTPMQAMEVLKGGQGGTAPHGPPVRAVPPK